MGYVIGEYTTRVLWIFCFPAKGCQVYKYNIYLFEVTCPLKPMLQPYKGNPSGSTNQVAYKI